MTTIGVLGAGQLGRMLGLAGHPLGLRCRFLDPADEAPAAAAGEWVCGDYDDPLCLDTFLDGLALVTYEFENVPVELARRLAERLPVCPPPAALEASQDRLIEKQFLNRLGVPTAPFAAVDDRAGLDRAIAAIGCPAVLKTRRFGYDGKGQAVLRSPADADAAYQAMGGAPAILEGFVRFERELSQIAVRGRDGQTAFYPLVENHHAGGILRLTLAPAPALSPELQVRACGYAARVLLELDYVGVLAIEFFQAGGRLLANEMAPRVHNSGHWTIEGAATSQFENHLRAVLGWPLGTIAVPQPCAMVNLIGAVPDPAAVLAVPDAHLHLYGKAPRPGRKLGHVTVRADSADQLRARLTPLAPLPGVAIDLPR